MASVPRRRIDGEITEPALRQPPAPMILATPEKASPPPSNMAMLSPEEIYRLIQEVAYFKAEARQFAPGVELQDWLDAEREVRQRLQAS